jgi:hypothetical protein
LHEEHSTTANSKPAAGGVPPWVDAEVDGTGDGLLGVGDEVNSIGDGLGAALEAIEGLACDPGDVPHPTRISATATSAHLI